MKFSKQLVKGFAAGVAATMLLGTTAFAATEYVLPLFEAKLVFNGVEKTGSDKPYQYFNGQTHVPTSLNYSGTTYVPLRFFSESCGIPVKYEGATKTIYVGEIPADGIVKGYLSDILKPYYVEQNYRAFETNNTMTMAGKPYSKGFQLQNLSIFDVDKTTTKFSFNLNANYKKLSGIIGLDDSMNTSNGVVRFYGDEKLIKEFTINKGSLPQDMNLDITGVIKLDVQFSCEFDQDNMWCKINLADLKIE